MSSGGKNYHHGNLRDALIVAAAAIIEMQGSLEFSITDAARRAGVSVAAPYRHFKDKEDLLHNVRDLAFMGLREALIATIEGAGQPAHSQASIIAIGHTYLRYAREKSAFFGLMWEDRGNIAEIRDTIEQKMSGFYILVDVMRGYFAQRGTGGASHTNQDTLALSVATQLWALAHGIATLELNHMLDLFDREATPEHLLETSTRALLTGLERQVPQSEYTRRRTCTDSPESTATQAELPL